MQDADAIAADYDRRQQLLASDGATSIRLGARALKGEREEKNKDVWRGKGMSLLQLICGVHTGSGARKKTGQLLEAAKSWLIALALSLGFGNAMEIIRELLHELFDNLVFIDEPSPPEFSQRLEDLITVFVSGVDPTSEMIRTILRACVTGDPQCTVVIVYNNGQFSGREDAVMKWKGGMTRVLAAHACPIWQERLWTGHTSSQDWAGVFEGCHRLLSQAYLLFCIRLGHRVPKAPTGSVSLVPSLPKGSDAEHLDEVDPGEEEQTAAEAALAPKKSAGAEAGSKSAGAGSKSAGPQDEFEKLQAENSRHRRKTLRGLLTQAGPLPALVTDRNGNDSWKIYMEKMLKASGMPTQTQQLALEAEAKREGKEGLVNQRTYRGLLAAEAVLERDAVKRIAEKMTHRKYWATIECLSFRRSPLLLSSH